MEPLWEEGEEWETVTDYKGDFDDVVLGYSDPNQYKTSSKEPCYRAIVGRFCNRIAKGKFSIDELEYKLEINNVYNHLHGGGAMDLMP